MVSLKWVLSAHNIPGRNGGINGHNTVVPGFRYQERNLGVDNSVGLSGTKAHWVNHWKKIIFHYRAQSYRHKYYNIPKKRILYIKKHTISEI